MSPQTTLSEVLSGIARAVVSAQAELDLSSPPSDAEIQLAPLSFVMHKTQLELIGKFTIVRSKQGTKEKIVTVGFETISPLQASLRRDSSESRYSTISVSIQAIEPRNDKKIFS